MNQQGGQMMGFNQNNQQQGIRPQQVQNQMQTNSLPQANNTQVPPGANQPNAPQNTAPPPAQPAQQKELNLLTLCRIGQETVQDIVTRFQEVFSLLKQVHPPNGTQQGTASSSDRKLKVQEQFRTIRLLFKRLRLLYDKCNDTGQQGIEYTDIMSFVPLKDELDNRPDPIATEEFKKVLQENRELIETVTARNKHLKEMIDKLRIIIWEINTMLSMRRS